VTLCHLLHVSPVACVCLVACVSLLHVSPCCVCFLVADDLTSGPTSCHVSLKYAFARQDIQQDTATDDQASKYQSRSKSLHPCRDTGTDLERQDLPGQYLAWHVPESGNIVAVLSTQLFTVYIVAAICSLMQKRNAFLCDNIQWPVT